MIVAVVNQKGGAAKSTLARGLAVEFARAKWSVLLADLDVQQQSSTRWAQRRAAAHIKPDIEAQVFARIDGAMAVADRYNLVILDGAPAASRGTAQAAAAADLVLVPTGTGIDDLEPSLNLGAELVQNGLDPARLLYVVTKATNSNQEVLGAKSTVRDWDFAVTNGYLPYSTGYSKAQDQGRAITETSFAPLNQRASHLLQEIINRLTGNK